MNTNDFTSTGTRDPTISASQKSFPPFYRSRSRGLISFRTCQQTNKIVITQGYHDMYYRILSLREKDHRVKGVLLTGQPGIGALQPNSSPTTNLTGSFVFFSGKTTFLKFMLVRLILAKQVVIICNHIFAFLFYKGNVYRQKTKSSSRKSIGLFGRWLNRTSEICHHAIVEVQTPGRFTHHFQGPIDIRRGPSSMTTLCWGYLYGLWRSS